jgi:hypothetical protein
VSGSVNDWHLPSSAELNELCKYVKNGASGNLLEACSGAYGARSSFFVDINVSHFWSSTQSSSTNGAFGRSFWTGGTTDWAKFSSQPKVRPIRAVLAPSCANGGACIVGDTGPGGGTVFYVHPGGGTFACGSALTSTCRYLEAAPTSGASAWTDARYWWSGNTSTAIGSDARGVAIGTGLKNTVAMVNQSNTANRAGTISRAYRGPNNLTDWYLPSQAELGELCKYARNQTTGDTTVECTLAGSIRSGFVELFYWSSTEIDGTFVRVEDFFGGNRGPSEKFGVGSGDYVRPVRAFG